MLKRTKIRMIGLSLLALGLASPIAGMAGTDTVVLRLKNADFEVRGALKSFDGDKYVVESSSFGVLSLTAAQFDCEGAACMATALARPERVDDSLASTLDLVSASAVEPERFRIAGSDTISRELMPAIIRDYAASIGGGVEQLVGALPDQTEFKVFDGNRALVASVGIDRTSPSAAFRAVARGRADVAVSTRPIDPVEQAELRRIAPLARPDEHEHVIALDGLAVIVSPDRPLASLPADKLAAIFSGKVRTWQELGLSGGAINIYVAGDAAGSDDITGLVLKSSGARLAPAARRLASEFEVSDAVTRDPDGIGLTSYAMLRNAKAAGIIGPCGITQLPSEFAIKAEEYPLSRRLYLYTAGEPVAATAGRLVRYANSDAAQAMIRDTAFMDQTVVASPAVAEGERIKAWLATAAPGQLERAMTRNLTAETGDGVRLSITFRFRIGSSQLDAKALQDLARLASLLKEPAYKGKTIVLAGFTDSVGTPAANGRLSIKRAGQVRQALLAAAGPGTFDASRIVAEGFGPAAPVACDDGADGNNKNRRVEVWIRDRPAVVRSVEDERDEPVVRRKKRKRSG